MDPTLTDIGQYVMNFYQENKETIHHLGIAGSITVGLTGLTFGYCKLKHMYQEYDKKRLAKLPFEEQCKIIIARDRASYFRYEDY